jgi:hypothetical protein
MTHDYSKYDGLSSDLWITYVYTSVKQFLIYTDSDFDLQSVTTEFRVVAMFVFIFMCVKCPFCIWIR